MSLAFSNPLSNPQDQSLLQVQQSSVKKSRSTGRAVSGSMSLVPSNNVPPASAPLYPARSQSFAQPPHSPDNHLLRSLSSFNPSVMRSMHSPVNQMTSAQSMVRSRKPQPSAAFVNRQSVHSPNTNSTDHSHEQSTHSNFIDPHHRHPAPNQSSQSSTDIENQNQNLRSNQSHDSHHNRLSNQASNSINNNHDNNNQSINQNEEEIKHDVYEQLDVSDGQREFLDSMEWGRAKRKKPERQVNSAGVVVKKQLIVIPVGWADIHTASVEWAVLVDSVE